MYQINRDGVSVKVVLDKRNSLKNGLYRIRICVIYKRVVRLYTTGKAISADDWEDYQIQE